MGKCMEEFVNKLMAVGNLEKSEFTELLKFRNIETTEYLNTLACTVRNRRKKDVIQIWGRVPVSNFCKYDCQMCGIRRGNRFARRYRMEPELVLACCDEFAGQGIRSFLLESGDDVYYDLKRGAELIRAVKLRFPESRVILALGEKTEAVYREWYRVGADSYILRHGSADELHFKRMYPSNMSQLLRRQSLWQLQGAGYRTGTGFLVGIPYQTIDNVYEDLQFMKSFAPAIVDMGAFLPAFHTSFERERSGNGEMTLYLLAILRLMLPDADIIAEPTLDCVLKAGRSRAFSAGADVLLVDLAEEVLQKNYCVYERKNGRQYLPPDHLETLKADIRAQGWEHFE